MKENDITEEEIQLNALADGELSVEESESLLSSIEGDADLRTDLCDIHRVKDMMHYAYADVEMPARHRQSGFVSHFGLSIAASLLLAVGAVLGALVTNYSNTVTPFNLAQVEEHPERVMLYVGFSDNKKFEEALQKAEYLLENYSDKGVKVNVVTSAGGVDMLRARKSPYTDQIKQLADNYSALSFVACNNTLAKLKAQGQLVELVDEAEVAPSAVQFVVGRLQEGWSYVAI